MAKAVLVMDMPESCFGCNFMHCDTETDTETCQVTETARDIDLIEDRPDWCPLRELPEKKENDSFLIEAIKNDCFDGTDSGAAYFNGKDAGWNACLDNILKDDGLRKE